MEIRPYDAARDCGALWELKRGFELGLGTGTGDDEKRAAYEGKLTDAYRRRYLDWVDRCVDGEPRCVTVAADGDAAAGEEGATVGEIETGGEGAAVGQSEADGEGTDGHLAGYVFVLPESLAMIWDAAVLNEIYVRPRHRGTGVADDLVSAALDLARDQTLPLDRMVLDVDRDNERAVGFYERHGFEHWGEMVARAL